MSDFLEVIDMSKPYVEEPPKTQLWRLDKERLCLVHGERQDYYEVDLERCETVASLTDWIIHLTEKQFISTVALGEFVQWIGYLIRNPLPGLKVAKDLYAPDGSLEKAFKERNRVTKERRWRILARDNFTCTACGKSARNGAVLEVDHIVPISKGGKSDDSNLRSLCTTCNRGKGSGQ